MSLFSKRSELEPGQLPGPSAHHAYGIDDAIQLMRTLPMNQNADLVLLVIRNTLASMNVELGQVIDDGAVKQEKLRNKIASITTAMAELQQELDTRRAELAAVEADLSETTLVRERLEQAASHKPLSAPPRPPVRARAPMTPSDDDRHTMEVEPLPDSEAAPQQKAQ